MPDRVIERIGARFGMLALALTAYCCSQPSAYAQSGYQTINGTRVFTEIDQAARVATFSNECGTQRLTQAQLQAGAIPDEIIPCPRPSAPHQQSNPSPPSPNYRSQPPPQDFDNPIKSPPTTGGAFDRALREESRCEALANTNRFADAARCYSRAAKLYSGAGASIEDETRMRNAAERMKRHGKATGRVTAPDQTGRNASVACGGVISSGYESVGFGEKGKCVYLVNKCAYLITFTARSSSAGLLSTAVEPGKRGKHCATKPTEDIEYVGWRRRPS
jgi:hypothetical protein